MTDTNATHINLTDTEVSFDEYDEIHSPRPEVTDLDRIIESAINRRGFIGGVVTFGLGSFLLGTTALTSRADASADRFGFAQIPAGTADTIVVPDGYDWKTLVSWGDPLWSNGPEFDHDTRGTAASQELAFGDNNDGMALFSSDGRVVFAVNNEYTNRGIIWGNRPDGKAANDDDIRKGMLAHGVSVFEIAEGDDGWSVVKDSPFNRRITPETEMEITGPAAGSDLLKTEADPTGTRTLGTWNNCGNGETPWGTYLACEENFNGYFSSTDADYERSPAMQRYGVNIEDWGYGWAKIDERFDISRHPNEANRAGYVVEIDPFDPTSTPKKRTALGRFKHENADVVIASDGRVVVYMGDDERGEFLYRFISDGEYVEGGDNSELLASGTLYVAKFSDDLTGMWMAMTPDSTGMRRSGNRGQLPNCCLEARCDDHGSSRVGCIKPAPGGILRRADQQQEPRHQAECGWRSHSGHRPEPARSQCLWTDSALAPRWRRPYSRHLRLGSVRARGQPDSPQ